MARSFAITTTATDTLQADAQGHAQAVFTVTNSTSRPIRGLAKVKALGDTKRDWINIEGEAERDFAAGTTQQFTVNFDAKPEPAAAPAAAGTAAGTSAASKAGETPTASSASGVKPGKYSFRLDVASSMKSDEDFTEGPVVTVEVPALAAPVKKKFPIWIIPVIAVVLIALGLTLWLLLRTKKVEVPSVVGKSVADATSAIEANKLKANVTGTVLTGTVAAGAVVTQDPAGGAKAPEGSMVALVVEGEKPTPSPSPSPSPTPTSPTPQPPRVLINFADQAPLAQWGNDAGHVLPFNGSDVDARGFVINRDNAGLENGARMTKVIETHPRWADNGNIFGTYTLPEPLKEGDKFKTQVGFLAGARAGNLRLYVLLNGNIIQEMSKSYDGSLRNWTVDLSDWAGQSGKFTLMVVATPTSAQGWICWINPRIERPGSP
ncbi:MAG TPA: PASTA domain-containing protein [Pyrinomonadaceae bacterium]|nr:PASTA domain-containing protein [Pyrinomonadaceae bacterium]